MEILYYLRMLTAAYFVVVLFMKSTTSLQFDVLDFGAVGNGIADDTQAFSKAWAETCGATSNFPTMVVPRGKAYLVRPIIFKGPCKPSNITFQVGGTILAPDSPSTWNGLDTTQWLQFDSVNGLTMSGLGVGVVNGRGSNWWKQSCRYNNKKGCTRSAPTAIKFVGCYDLHVSHLSSIDSAQTHFLIFGGGRVRFDNIRITAPGDSPNTDGIHIQSSHYVTIEDLIIGTGDDCISIGDSIYSIIINRIICGPGHGISVGSLGIDGSAASVKDVHVNNVQFHETTNGARIKAWQGGSGFVKGVSFENVNFTKVDNPIVIDQYYCNVANHCPRQKTGVEISDVTYANFQGSVTTPYAISINCSDVIPCTGLHFDKVNLVPAAREDPAAANCINAYGTTHGYIHPSIPRLKSI